MPIAINSIGDLLTLSCAVCRVLCAVCSCPYLTLQAKPTKPTKPAKPAKPAKPVEEVGSGLKAMLQVSALACVYTHGCVGVGVDMGVDVCVRVCVCVCTRVYVCVCVQYMHGCACKMRAFPMLCCIRRQLKEDRAKGETCEQNANAVLHS